MALLPLRDLKDKLMGNTGFFETSRTSLAEAFKVSAGNFDGAGMSHGALQYNFGPADRLQELWLYMLQNHRSVVQTAFGSYTAEFTEFETVITTYTRAQRITWGDGITDYTRDTEGKKLILKWETIFSNLGSTAESQAKYKEMSDRYYYPSPESIFRQMSCTSRMALASFYDIYVNKGRYYPINCLQADFEAIDADTTIDETEKERQKIYQINFRGNEEENGLNDSSSETFWHRRGCMANQGGNYYGLTYDPDVQFDMTQDPALEEKTVQDIFKGNVEISNVFKGTTTIQKVYVGNTVAYILPYTLSTAPTTQFRNLANGWQGVADSVTIASGSKIWVDVTNFVACKTYYTLDGTTPTVNSTLYTGGIVLTSSATLKTLTVSIFGVAEPVKSIVVTVGATPTTTISPTETVQNTIPITVTLSATNATTTYYRLGATGATQVYTAPFQVNQNTAGVASPNIKVTYWSENANGLEPEKSITYNTSGAIPAKPVVSVTNGVNQVVLNWAQTANTTSYTVYRSQTAGQIGTIISQYQAPNTYTDTTAVGGQTYFYTVRAGNYSLSTDSDQVMANPTEPITTSSKWRYVRYQGFGDNTNSATTRLVELQAIGGGTNFMLNKSPISGEAVSTGGAITKATDGLIDFASGQYPIWWIASGVPTLVYDLGAEQTLDSLLVAMYSPSFDPRQTRFKLDVSRDNVNWTLVADYTANAQNQPTTGWSFTAPTA